MKEDKILIKKFIAAIIFLLLAVFHEFIHFWGWFWIFVILFNAAFLYIFSKLGALIKEMDDQI